MDFFTQMPEEMLLDLIRERQRELRNGTAEIRHPAPVQLRPEAVVVRAVGRLRRLITATGGAGR